MSDTLILIVIILFVLYTFYRLYNPNIEIVQIGINKYKILLWYNAYTREKINRNYIKLFNLKL